MPVVRPPRAPWIGPGLDHPVQSLGGYRRHCESLKGVGAVVSAEIPAMSYINSIDKDNGKK